MPSGQTQQKIAHPLLGFFSFGFVFALPSGFRERGVGVSIQYPIGDAIGLFRKGSFATSLSRTTKTKKSYLSMISRQGTKALWDITGHEFNP